MTDRPPDAHANEALERRLRDAFRSAAPPSAPPELLAAVRTLDERPGLARSRSWFGRLPVAVGALAVLVAVAFTAALLSTGRHSTTQGEGDPSAVGSGSGGTCEPSPGLPAPGTGDEVGGPRAFFAVYDEPYTVNEAPWKLLVRFDPDFAADSEVAVWAVHLETGEREESSYSGPANVEESIDGEMHLFIQPLTLEGCWRLTAAVDGEVAGTAIIEVAPARVPAPE